MHALYSTLKTCHRQPQCLLIHPSSNIAEKFALDKSENKKSNERIEMEFATIADAKRNAEIVYW